ncbi:MAG: tRNA (N6-threonylcarbamoyladenosine(37)-N6)-methyltransferase TrmO [Candidatus Omnitrophota bacterium]|nr:tRNA (N6-threonylcarbamoyladenosine(37)-N6)-methyltransferase TrmO [Candidatus Omnitrophota bacterium]
MSDDKFVFQSIGVIHSPHKEISKIPIQPVFCKDIEGTVILNSEYAEGLKDLQGFSHIYLFYYFHQSRRICLHLKTYLSNQKHGIFATRAPHRPNKLGMSLVRLVKIKDNILHIKDIDILDGTPLLDIKPYIQRFDSKKNTRSGWQDTISDDTASMRGLRHFKR